MLLKSQRNTLLEQITRNNLQVNCFAEDIRDEWYKILYVGEPNIRFEIARATDKEGRKVYRTTRRPGYSSSPDSPAVFDSFDWDSNHYSCVKRFKDWVAAVKREVEAPDLWLETTKAVRLFAPASDLAADRFIIAELGAVQGQLRILNDSFAASRLPNEAKIKLAGLTQTAVLKAETLTKKDWQNWVVGAFTSAIVTLNLNESETQEVLALVRLAFGGLFLNG